LFYCFYLKSAIKPQKVYARISAYPSLSSRETLRVRKPPCRSPQRLLIVIDPKPGEQLFRVLTHIRLKLYHVAAEA